AEIPLSARGLAKAAGGVQRGNSFNSQINEKSRRLEAGGFLNSGASGRPRWAVRYPALLRPRVAVVAPAGPMMLPAVAAMTAEACGLLPAAEPGKHDKAMLLRVVQALVERPGGIGELLQRSRALTHDFGAENEGPHGIPPRV